MPLPDDLRHFKADPFQLIPPHIAGWLCIGGIVLGEILTRLV